MDITEFKVVASNVRYGKKGTILANIPQRFEQSYRFNFKNEPLKATIVVENNQAKVSISRKSMCKKNIQELLDLCPLLKDKKYDCLLYTSPSPRD